MVGRAGMRGLLMLGMLLLACGAGLGIVACSSKGKESTGPVDNPKIAISVDPNSATVSQGAAATVSASLTRSGGFTGDVALSVEGAPSGVSVSFTYQTNGTVTSASGTLQVALTVPVGTYTLSLKATGTGVDPATATFTLTVTAAPAYSLALTPTSGTVNQGASDTVQVAITRTNYGGAITLSLGGAPTGVTGTFTPAAPTGTSAQLVIAVGAAVASGPYTLTVSGAGAAGFVAGGGAASPAIVDQTVPFTLTVALKPDFSLSLTQAALSIVQGASSPTTTVNIARTNFNDPITLGLTGTIPNGVTFAFNPPAPATNSSVLTITVGASVTPGVYNLNVSGTGSPGTHSTPLTLTVTATVVGPGITLDFSACRTGQKPVWLAFLDGLSGTWVEVAGSGDVYHVMLTQPRGAVVFTTIGSSGPSTHHFWFAATDTDPGVSCQPAGKTVHGQVAGMPSGEVTAVSLGGSKHVATQNGAITLTNVLDGSQDLIAYTRPLQAVGSSDRMFIRRAQNVPDGGSLSAPIDMAGPESFSPSAAQVTVLNLGPDQLSHGASYVTGNCVSASLYDPVLVNGSTFFTYGVAPGLQQPTDLHELFVEADAGASAQRTLRSWFHTLAPQTVTLGSSLAVPTISSLAAPYKRLQVSFDLPADYRGEVSFVYFDNVTFNSVDVEASFAFLGGTGAQTLTIPDLSSVPGFNLSWMPASGNQTQWDLAVSNVNLASTGCMDGFLLTTAERNGIF